MSRFLEHRLNKTSLEDVGLLKLSEHLTKCGTLKTVRYVRVRMRVQMRAVDCVIMSCSGRK